MNRKMALIVAGVGAGASAALAVATTANVVRRTAPKLKAAVPSRFRRSGRSEIEKTKSNGSSSSRNAHWLMGGTGGALAAWGAAQRGPLRAIAGLAGAAMVSRATLRRG